MCNIILLKLINNSILRGAYNVTFVKVIYIFFCNFSYEGDVATSDKQVALLKFFHLKTIVALLLEKSKDIISFFVGFFLLGGASCLPSFFF